MTSNTVEAEPITSTPKKRGCLMRLARLAAFLVVGLILLVAVVIVVSLIIESRTLAGELESNPPPGALISVGDHKLHAMVFGEGSPAVVFEAGLGATAVGWANVYPAIAEKTAVIVYDRAGTGWSEPGPHPRSAETIAIELNTLLSELEVDGPYIVAAHSLGGPMAREFQRRYPENVAGLVLIDSSHEEQYDRFTPAMRSLVDANAMLTQFLPYAARLGVMRLLMAAREEGTGAPDPIAMLPEESARAARMFGMVPESYRTMASEFSIIESGAATLAEPGSLGDLPLAVVTAGKNDYAKYLPDAEEQELMRETWRGLQEEQAALSTNSHHTVAEESGHMIPFEQPEAVIEAIHWVINEARSNPSK